MYICNEAVKTLVLANDYQRIRLVHAGVKILEKQEAGNVVSFRILEDGVAPLLPFVDPACIISADVDVLRVLLTEYYPPMTKFSEPYKTLLESLGACAACSSVPLMICSDVGNCLMRFEACSTPDATCGRA